MKKPLEFQLCVYYGVYEKYHVDLGSKTRKDIFYYLIEQADHIAQSTPLKVSFDSLFFSCFNSYFTYKHYKTNLLYNDKIDRFCVCRLYAGDDFSSVCSFYVKGVRYASSL